MRTSLNSRDRMMLVHETSNFHLERTATQGNPQRWTPEAVPTNRLMLTALGGWLDSRVLFETLPDGGLTIEEWKHRAALGRDHEVKVVYAGFLMPFGHRASLVKITERKFAAGPAGPVAYMFQRMFIIVREPVRKYPEGPAEFVDMNGETFNVGLSNPLGMVQILTTVTPPLDPPQSLPAVASGMFFQPRVGDANFPFKIVATDVENNVLEFEAPLVFVERDHNIVDGKLEAARNTYNTHALVDREFDLKGQKVAYADSVKPDDTMLSTSSLTFNVADPDRHQRLPGRTSVRPGARRGAGRGACDERTHRRRRTAAGQVPGALRQAGLREQRGRSVPRVPHAARNEVRRQRRPLRRVRDAEPQRQGAVARHRSDLGRHRQGR